MSKKSKSITGFVQLLTSHQEVLRSFILSMNPDYHDAADILQDVNLRLWERRSTFTPDSNFGVWACTMARYEVLNYRQQLKRHNKLIFSDELVEKLAEPTSTDQDPLYLQEKRSILHHCLKKLNPKEIALLKVRYTEKQTIVQQAKLLGTSAQSLRVTLFRARSALKHCVDYQKTLKEIEP